MCKDHWTKRRQEIEEEVQHLYLTEPPLYAEALADREDEALDLIRTLLWARQQAFKPSTIMHINSRLERVAIAYAHDVATAQIVKEQKNSKIILDQIPARR